MSVTRLTSEYYLPPPPQAVMGLGTAHTINGTTIKLGFIFSPPKAGNITKLVFRTGTVTTSAAVQLRVETVNTSGNPSGTLFHANGTGSQASIASNTYYAVTLASAGVPVTGNDTIAVVLASPSGTSNYIVQGVTAGIDTVVAFPYSGTATGTTWTKTTPRWLMAVGYDDGRYYPATPDMVPLDGVENVSIASTGTSYNEIGNVFTARQDMSVDGAWFLSSTNGACDIRLYTTSGTLLATSNVPAGIGRVTSAPKYVYFPAPVLLSAGVGYRIMVCATNSTAMTISGMQMPAAYTTVIDDNFTFQARFASGGGYAGLGTIRMNVGLIVDAMHDLGSSGKYRAKVGGTFVAIT